MYLLVSGGSGLALSSQSQIKKRRAGGMQTSNWKWHLDEVFVKINGERHYLWRASVRLVCLYFLYILTNLRLTYDPIH